MSHLQSDNEALLLGTHLLISDRRELFAAMNLKSQEAGSPVTKADGPSGSKLHPGPATSSVAGVEERKAELLRLIRAAENEQEPGPPRLDSAQWLEWNGNRLEKIEALRKELKSL